MTRDVDAARADIDRLGAFLSTPLAARLAQLGSNDVLTAASGSMAPSADVEAVVPGHWLDWLRSIDAVDHERTLKLIAGGREVRMTASQPVLTPQLTDAPASIVDFLSSCASLPFDRSMSDMPCFTTRSASSSIVPRIRTEGRRSTVGLSPKKAHEVERCLHIVRSVLGDVKHPHLLDLGSGRVRQHPSDAR